MLKDGHGRNFKYLRLSLTEECNFKCIYCLPDGYKRSDLSELPLTRLEIGNLIAGFCALQFEKIRLTGGEPTLRRDIVEIVEDISRHHKISELAISTNGYRLKQLAKPLKEAGLSAVNISMDTLDRERFRQITGLDRLNEVLQGIDASVAAGIGKIKINVVFMRDTADQDIPSFISWIKDKPFSVRFIEIMRTGSNVGTYNKQKISSAVLKLKLFQEGWMIKPRKELDGPAVEFAHPEYLGRVGIIAPYSDAFCESCNRLRVSSMGGLRLCLFGDSDISLRGLLKSPEQKDELVAKIQEVMGQKEKAHHLVDNMYGITNSLSSIGG